MSPQHFGKFIFSLDNDSRCILDHANKARQIFRQPHMKDTHQTLNPNHGGIQEVSIPAQPGRGKRLDVTTCQTGQGESSTGFRRTNKPDAVTVSTINHQESREDGTEPGLTHIIKLALSLGTIEQLMERLENAEVHAKAAETKVFEAKLIESNAKVKGESVESTFNTILNSIRRLQVDEQQAHFGRRRRQASFRAWWSKSKEEVINLVLEDKHEEQKITRRCIEQCKQKTNVLVDERERRERQVAIFRWCLVHRQPIKDFEKGMLESEVDELLNNN